MNFVVNRDKDKYDVYIGRPYKWGNPFRINKDRDRKKCVSLYAQWLLGKINAPNNEIPPSIEEIKRELKGKVLGCWCKPNLCHGDVLAKIANS